MPDEPLRKPPRGASRMRRVKTTSEALSLDSAPLEEREIKGLYKPIGRLVSQSFNLHERNLHGVLGFLMLAGMARVAVPRHPPHNRHSLRVFASRHALRGGLGAAARTILAHDGTRAVPTQENALKCDKNANAGCGVLS